MDLEEFRAFVGVVETGSFLAAATQLNMARATLRRRVEALEARAGVPLLERSARGVVVTEAGAVLAARGRHVLQEASALVASVREIGREPVGVLRALLPMGLPPHALTPLFAALRSAFPRLSLQLRFSEDPVASALEDVDLLVHFGPTGPAGPWLSHEVWRLREWLVATTEYVGRRGTPKSLEELARHEVLAWAPPGEDPRVLPTLTGESFEVEPSLISADVHCLRQMVLAGLGIGFLPDALLPDPGVPDGVLVPVLPELVGRSRGLHVVVPAAQAGLPKLRSILQHVRAFAERSAALRAG